VTATRRTGTRCRVPPSYWWLGALDNVGAPPRICDATPGDWPAIWAIVREVVVAADTFAYDPQMSEEEARALWMVTSPSRTTVAVAGTEVSGTANMYANRAGPGVHVMHVKLR
jgi:hypothetical protein